ncbi:succinate dehydrogenase cytochrome b556 large subunit [Salinivibrio sp. MA351]|uniref:Succinate dehydrogenase cytochrome b556 subunit n=1 Tax=Salinivibrio costicola subsp. alcaliphilus TaxID=272773 RepID=A0ABX3KUY1_SALCS|nr:MULTISPECIES: succinate dehydrogenase cytochrome b556 subunit [Salinivibrio]NUY55514.1 succinate dehydrogenase cytochrome b556 subunit [Salinivibrio sp. EAGSL]OOE93774.1 succinate dehydrogenase cytochrome b556 large subunit [Salinivibrio sp. AR647]OOE95855.1 succinate dehydrogenase cytochrome b556 large subunit [Salinivibrio sp. AR640]OOE97150.1 succinate dehydrogenase cytochrome b556 large subunit [Salinivibrio sp. MA351]OOE97302.1 succinate dehydrogenase cytochrome b556 large subunit [Sal
MGNIVKERKSRPVNLDLKTIRFPITAIASILHRISGVITFVSIAILLWLLSLSLSSPDGFQSAAAILDTFFVKLVLWGILTALAYHIVGGIRHLIQDLGYFEELESGAKSAQVSFVIAGVLAVLAGVLVW